MNKAYKLALAIAVYSALALPASAQPGKKTPGKPSAPKPAPAAPAKPATPVAPEAPKPSYPAETPAGTKLIEVVSPIAGKLVIPYAKFKLKNGLTLVVHEDKSDPIVHVDVTYHVGSSREHLGISGFAHFFEHMMFQGSKNVADEEHFKIVSESGGELNGTTNTDRTNYFETMPSNQLETALWLESDRMGFLLPAVTQKKFEVQRATVKNERGQNYDNRPYGLVNEVTTKNLYPYGHPYGWSPIGYVEDLNRVGVDDLKRFFMRWYGPDNATLTVGGDCNTMDVVRLAEKYFLSIPAGKAVEPLKKVMLSLDKDRYISGEDQILYPLLYMAYPTVPGRHKDEPALDCLAEIIGGGSNGLLYKNLDKKRLAVQSGANHPCQELAGEFTIQVVGLDGKPLANMEKIVRETFAEFEKRGATDEDLERFKAGYESNSIRSLGEVSGKVSQLAFFQTFYGNPNIIQEEIDRRNAVTKEDVMRAYNTYIKGKGAVILSWVPKGKKELIAAPNNFRTDSTKYEKPLVDEYKGLTYTEPTDSFDRSKRPAAGANPVVKIPKYWNQKWANGVKVIGAESKELPTVGMLITLKGGHIMEQNMKDKAGIAELVANLMNESTEKFSTEEFESQEILYGANIRISNGAQSMSIYMDALTKNIDGALALLEERMFHPRFSPDDFDRIKQQTIQGIENSKIQPSTISRQVFAKLMYGKDHIYSVPTSGTIESIKSITLDDVKKYYKDYFSSANAEVVIVGNVDEKEFTGKLDFLKNWAAKPITMPVLPATPAAGKTRIYLVNKDNAPQTEIRTGYMALPYDATGEFYKSNLMNFALGGAFNSRINLNLREDKGWTYGSNSGFRGSEIPGPFVSAASVKGSATDSALFEMMKEIKNYRENGITEAELEFTKKSIGQSEAREYETLEQKAGFLNQIQHYNLPANYVDQQQAILNGLTKEEVKALAAKNLPVDEMIILVVGDKAKIKKPLQRLGYEIIELDTKGDVVVPGAKAKDAPSPWK